MEPPTDPDEPIIPNPKVLHWYFALRAGNMMIHIDIIGHVLLLMFMFMLNVDVDVATSCWCIPSHPISFLS